MAVKENGHVWLQVDQEGQGLLIHPLNAVLEQQRVSIGEPFHQGGQVIKVAFVADKLAVLEQA